MGEMERRYPTEIQPGNIEEYTQGIAFKHIEGNAVVYRVMQMVYAGDLTEIEGLRLMVNTLADENKILNEQCSDLIMRMPSCLLAKTIRGEK